MEYSICTHMGCDMAVRAYEARYTRLFRLSDGRPLASLSLVRYGCQNTLWVCHRASGSDTVVSYTTYAFLCFTVTISVLPH